MTGWTAKRFWKQASVVTVENGYTVHLDSRAVKTPAKAALILPTFAMAEAIAAEWDAQTGKVRPETMPFTRAANSSIDKVTPLFDAVVDEISGFGGSDLLCYRAEAPAELSDRQSKGWDPHLAWAKDDLGAPLNVTQGVIPVDQPVASLKCLRAVVEAHTAFQLMALHDLVAISGSLILGLAVVRKKLTAHEGFELSRIDERWQSEQWGEDEEAAEIESVKRLAFENAAAFFGLCG